MKIYRVSGGEDGRKYFIIKVEAIREAKRRDKDYQAASMDKYGQVAEVVLCDIGNLTRDTVIALANGQQYAKTQTVIWPKSEA